MVIAPTVRLVHPRVMAATVAAIRETEEKYPEWEGRIISGERDDAAQLAEWNKGRDPRTGEIVNIDEVVTYARTAFETAHGSRLATDTTFINRKTGRRAADGHAIWLFFGKSAEKHGMEWGGRWKELIDKPHVQMPKWKEHRGWDSLANRQEGLSPWAVAGFGLAFVGIVWLAKRR